MSPLIVSHFANHSCVLANIMSDLTYSFIGTIHLVVSFHDLYHVKMVKSDLVPCENKYYKSPH